MTDWIKELGAKLTSEQKRRIAEDRATARRADLIESRSPEFVAGVERKVRELADELIQELGEKAVKISTTTPVNLTAKSDKREAHVKFTHDKSGEQIKVTYDLRGGGYIGDAAVRLYRLNVDGDGNIYASQAPYNEQIKDPAQIAERELKELFKSLFS